MTHFGSSEDVDAQLDEVGRRLDAWAERARGQERAQFIAAVQREIDDGAEPELVPAYTQAAPPEQLYAGLERYWRKRAASESGAAQVS
jgi:hypothetical protein